MSAIESVLQNCQLRARGAREDGAISGMPAYRRSSPRPSRTTRASGRLARENLSWHKPFTKVLDESNAPFCTWFDDGELNASYNCLDRHVEAGNGQRVAVIFEADDGTVTRVTYAELLARVSASPTR
jgi:acetyl-CoA synthetase